MTEFPRILPDVLSVIHEAERSRKYVWTAGRILIEAGLEEAWSNTTAKDKKQILRRITKLLEALSSNGILVRRKELQSIGYGHEKGFDYVSALKISN